MAALAKGGDARLRQQEALFAAPDVDLVQALAEGRAFERAADRLAVEGHDLPVERLGQALHPRPHAVRKGRRAQRAQHAPEGVDARHAVRHVDELGEPVRAVACDLFEIVPAVGARQHVDEGHHNDRQQGVLGSAGHAGVLEAGEVLSEAQGGVLRRGCVRHGLRPQRHHVNPWNKRAFGAPALPDGVADRIRPFARKRNRT
jgi:hypothetical protein